MSKCQNCESERILKIQGKCSDRFGMWGNNGQEYYGYVPDNIGIGGNDNIEFSYCLECGQIQGEFPVNDPEEFEEYDDTGDAYPEDGWQ